MADSNAGLPERLLATLPFLRRYARALTGSQSRGDEWVRLCVEVVLRQPELVRNATSTVDIFRLFHQLQQPFDGLQSAEAAGDVTRPLDRLRAHMQDMADVQRKVLLLTMLEDFSVEEVAQILDIAPDDADQALREAQEQLRRGASVRVLIIEDEAVIALDVAEIVRGAGHQVVGVAASERTAIELAAKHSPDLVVADVQLKDGDDGRTAVRQILKSLPVPVIFVTGFPERLLTGQGLEPAFVITKPFAPDQLRTAMAQALSIAAI